MSDELLLALRPRTFSRRPSYPVHRSSFSAHHSGGGSPASTVIVHSTACGSEISSTYSPGGSASTGSASPAAPTLVPTAASSCAPRFTRQSRYWTSPTGGSTRTLNSPLSETKGGGRISPPKPRNVSGNDRGGWN